MGRPDDPSRLDWLSMSLAGGVLGLTFALLCSMVFGRLPLGIAPPIHAQLTMWMVPPVWFSVVSASFAFGTGKRAWTWLGVANLVVLLPAAAGLLL